MIRELLLPTTDAGALVQAGVVALVAVAAIAASWRRSELRLLAVGLTLVAAGLLGLRAVH